MCVLTCVRLVSFYFSPPFATYQKTIQLISKWKKIPLTHRKWVLMSDCPQCQTLLKEKREMSLHFKKVCRKQLTKIFLYYFNGLKKMTVLEHNNAVFLKKLPNMTYYAQVRCFYILESAAGKGVCLGELVSLTL